jgi:hypothetical protein
VGKFDAAMLYTQERQSEGSQAQVLLSHDTVANRMCRLWMWQMVIKLNKP